MTGGEFELGRKSKKKGGGGGDQGGKLSWMKKEGNKRGGGGEMWGGMWPGMMVPDTAAYGSHTNLRVYASKLFISTFVKGAGRGVGCCYGLVSGYGQKV